eukprot:519641-Rhodomonas_salina.1
MIEGDAQHSLMLDRLRALPPSSSNSSSNSSSSNALMVRVDAMTREDSEQLVASFLFAKYRKSLSNRQLQTMLDKQDAGSPLYLVTACAWLAQFGVYEEMDEEVRALPGLKLDLLSAMLASLIARFGEPLIRELL